MSKTGESEALTLADLRARIDAIDAELHRLLIERGTVIDALIKVKGTSLPGAAFRPGREAEMMRGLVSRHSGALPFAIVEHIWREIITTFTRMQAPFALVIDGSCDIASMRDLARFYFGFSVEIETLPDAGAVIARIAATGKDLGLVALSPSPRQAWWRGLGGAGRPQIMAVLPFIRVAGRPADMPAFVISPPLADPTPPDISIYAATVTTPASAAAAIGGEVLATVPLNGSAEVILAVPGTRSAADLASAAAAAGVTLEGMSTIGGIARGIAIGQAASLLYNAGDLRGEMA